MHRTSRRTSGGTRIGSDIDFASGYLCHVLGCIGIDDVTILDAGAPTDRAIERARTQITELVGNVAKPAA